LYADQFSTPSSAAHHAEIDFAEQLITDQRVDEVCGMLAEKGTELADPLVIGREVSPGRGCRSAGTRGRQAAFR
jgi:hypothetical protein